MRKGLGLLFALSMLVPVGVIGAGSVGAATNTKLPTCKSLGGTQTYTPGLPKRGVATLVKPVTKTDIKITGCTGGGITSGVSTSSSKATKGTNCDALFAAAGKPATPSAGTIKWSNGQTSTTSNVLTVTGLTPTGVTAKLVSKYTAGLGKGKTSTVLVNAVLNKGWCATAALTKSTFKSTKITTT